MGTTESLPDWVGRTNQPPPPPLSAADTPPGWTVHTFHNPENDFETKTVTAEIPGVPTREIAEAAAEVQARAVLAARHGPRKIIGGTLRAANPLDPLRGTYASHLWKPLASLPPFFRVVVARMPKGSLDGLPYKRDVEAHLQLAQAAERNELSPRQEKTAHHFGDLLCAIPRLDCPVDATQASHWLEKLPASSQGLGRNFLVELCELYHVPLTP